MRVTKPILLTLAAGFVLLSGCTGPDGSELKQQAVQALAKQQDMTSYSFQGEADLSLGQAPSLETTNPIAQTLTGMFTSGKLAWTGTASTQPLRLEAKVDATPAGGATAISLPIQVNDNKLFLSIPLLNKSDEYFSLDFAKLAELAGRPSGTADTAIKQAPAELGKLGSVLVDAIDPKWFEAGSKEEGASKDSKARTVRVPITEKNRQAMTDALRAKWPDLIDQAASAGLLTTKQAADYKESGAKSVEVKAPGLLEFKIDEKGFLHELVLQIKLNATGSGGQTAERHLQLHQTYDAINENPPFQLEAPKKVRSFEEILKLLKPAK